MKNPRSFSSVIIQGIERSCNPLWNVSPIRGTAGGAEVVTAAAVAAAAAVWEEGWKSLSSRRNVTKRQLLSHPLSVMPINQPSLQPSSLTGLSLPFSLALSFSFREELSAGIYATLQSNIFFTITILLGSMDYVIFRVRGASQGAAGETFNEGH